MTTRSKLRNAIRGDQTLRKSIADQVDFEQHAGEGDLKVLRLEKISLNKHNPRKLNITASDIKALNEQVYQSTKTKFGESQYDQEILSIINNSGDKNKRERLENLFFLSKSIHTQGLIQPISVIVKPDGAYQILAGERRYFAHLMIGRETIRAMVRQQNHDHFSERTLSLIENIIREDLNTAEKIDYIEELIQIHEEKNGKGITSKDLSGLIHESERTCRRYLRYIGAPEQVRSNIRSGVLSSIRQIDDALIACKKGISINNEGDQQEEDTISSRVGRKRKTISLGKTKDVKVIKVIGNALFKLKIINGQPDIDWDDLEAVQERWNHIVEQVKEKES